MMVSHSLETHADVVPLLSLCSTRSLLQFASLNTTHSAQELDRRTPTPGAGRTAKSLGFSVMAGAFGSFVNAASQKISMGLKATPYRKRSFEEDADDLSTRGSPALYDKFTRKLVS